MPRTPKLKVEISAVDNLTRGLKSITGKARGLLSTALSPLGLATGGAGLYGIAKGLQSLTTSYAEMADGISKNARRAGVGIEWFQEISGAASYAGIGVDSMTKALKVFSRNLGGLKADTGPLFALLEKVGGQGLIKSLKGATPEEAFKLIVRAMEELPDPARKAALATAAFGRAGGELLTLFEGGQAEIDKVTERVRKFGRVLTDVEGRDAEAFADSMADVKSAMEGVRTEVGVNLTKAMQPMLGQFAEWLAANRGIVATKIVDTIKGVSEGLMSVPWDTIGTSIKTVWDMVGGLNGALTALGAMLATGAVYSGLTAIATHPVITGITALAASFAYLVVQLRELQGLEGIVNETQGTPADARARTERWQAASDARAYSTPTNFYEEFRRADDMNRGRGMGANPEIGGRIEVVVSAARGSDVEQVRTTSRGPVPLALGASAR